MPMKRYSSLLQHKTTPMRPLIFLIAANLCGILSMAQPVVAGRIVAQHVGLNADLSYSFRVQTVAVAQLLTCDSSFSLPSDSLLEVVAPLGRVWRYADGSLAVPSLQTSDNGLSFCNQELGIWVLGTKNAQAIERGVSPSRPQFAVIKSIFLHKTYQPAFAQSSDGVLYDNKEAFISLLNANDWQLNLRLLEQNAPEIISFLASTNNLTWKHVAKTNSLQQIKQPFDDFDTPEPEPFTFAPHTIAAGSDEVLTVQAAKGINFGTKRGNVFFTNAEMGLCNKRFYTNFCDSTDIITWTATEIKLKVPSNILSAYYMEHAGTGAFAVETADKKRIYFNRTPLMVPYSLVTERLNKKTLQKDRWYVANYHCERGLVFALDTTAIYKLTKGHAASYRDSLVTSIGAAVRHWQTLLPGVELSLRPYFIQPPYNADKHIRIISFSDDGYNPYREMYSYTTVQRVKTAGETHEKSVSVRSNLEINVRPVLIGDKIPYWVDTTLTKDKPAFTRDFYCTLLHEIGHLIGLQHTLNYTPDSTRDVMSMLTCGATTAQTAQQRPSPTKCFAAAQQGAQVVFHDSRLIRWSEEQGQVATLGSLSTPFSLAIYKHPQSKLVCSNAPIDASFKILPASKSYHYQWQTRLGKRPWSDFTDSKAFKGQKTASLQTTAQFKTLDAEGRQFRCLMSREGCTAYSSAASYHVGIKQTMPFRSDGISQRFSQPIELPRGTPEEGFFEGIGVSGAGGTWFFTPNSTPTAGIYPVLYKVRDEQGKVAPKSPTSRSESGSFCVAAQNVKVLNEKDLAKTHAVHIEATPQKIVFYKGQPATEAILINGAGEYRKSCVFLAQLSDKNGYFAPTTVDSLPNIVGFLTNPLAAKMPINLPSTLVSGRKYRLRLIQTAPFYISEDNGSDIIVSNALFSEPKEKIPVAFSRLLKR